MMALWKRPKFDNGVGMHRKSKRPRYLVLYALVVLACVGLALAVSHNRARRRRIENEHPKTSEVAEATITISTQVMSFKVSQPIELDDPLAAGKSLLLSARPERAPAAIIPSDPRVFVEQARKNIDYTPETNVDTNAPAPGEKIVTDE